MKRARRHKQSHHSKKEDRLSDLPDCVILRILSFLDTKPAIQTFILSKRWMNIWKHLTNLRLISSDFRNGNSFTEFVSQVFSLRDTLTSLYTLDFDSSGIMIKPLLLRRVINHAVSHNVQQLDISVTCDIEYLPSRLYSCQTLTSLDLSVYPPGVYAMSTVFPNSPNLPALIRLSLRSFTFRAGNDGCAEPFSTLSRGIPIHKLCGSKSNLSTIKHVNIGVDWSYTRDTRHLVLLQWLAELANIKSLTVTLSTLKVFSLVPDLLKLELPSLCNLKLLRVQKDRSSSAVPNEIVDFLIRNSPSAKVDIID